MEADSSELGSETVPDVALLEPASEKEERILRVQIDTSAPFESVKEAVTRFEGLGVWTSIHDNLSTLEQEAPEHDTGKLEEEAAVLEKELIVKEKETLDVLKELESTKRLVEDLKSRLQKEECEAYLKNKEEDKENQVNQLDTLNRGFSPYLSSEPGLILMELKQAKLNLTKTTNDIADVRASVVSLNKKLKTERASLERTRERLTHSSSKLSSLEEELSQTRLKLQAAKDDPSDITKELHRLCSEAEQFKRMGEAAKSEVLRTMSEIERTKSMIRTAELRVVAARKMKAAARAAESASLAEINVLSNNLTDSSQVVTLSFEEYHALTSKALEAEESSKRKVTDAMLQIDEANLSKTEILKRVEEATKEVQTCKKDLEEAMERVGAANRGKLAVEEALRKGHKRRPSSARNSTRFKNSHPSSHHRRDSLLVGVNGLELEDDEAKRDVPKTVLSIGEILSRKLLLSREFEAGSLGHMLGKQKEDSYFCKQFCAKRKKFGFARLSHLLGNDQKKKKPTLNLR
ncbi:WEB family protein At2g38370-like isoform X2 [Neltuma alba]|uniref:WEB family protein At2g38370-like isoform X2 n=1 Tax=Neltuma alba TaxID=207710 RepID=UPI0010A31650|nr:WEB family protein At2g38370-like isoform X2 [Prosopis alba]